MALFSDKKEKTPPKPAAPKTKTEWMKVAGVAYKEDDLKRLGYHNDDYDLTKKELREDFEEEKVYALDFDLIIELVPEPENPHDKNAIKVVADGVHVGYIPKKETAKVRSFMESGDLQRIRAEVTGGKYKLVTDENELIRDEDPFRIELGFTLLDHTPEPEPTQTSEPVPDPLAKFTTKKLKMYSNVFLVISVIAFIIGVPTFLFGGFVLVGIGALTLALSLKYKKAVKERSGKE